MSVTTTPKPYRFFCPKCSSTRTQDQGETCKCLSCGHRDAKRRFRADR